LVKKVYYGEDEIWWHHVASAFDELFNTYERNKEEKWYLRNVKIYYAIEDNHVVKITKLFNSTIYDGTVLGSCWEIDSGHRNRDSTNRTNLQTKTTLRKCVGKQ